MGITGRLNPVAARILTLDAGLTEAAARLRTGQLVAFPTETVYGLGADALNPEAVAAIFEAKGRPATNPVIVHVADIASARALSTEWTPLADALAQRFWPGPLTLVVRASMDVPSIVMAGGSTVGIRIPAHDGARALIAAAGCPVAAPSANRSEAISPTRAVHVAAGLGDWVDDLLIIDGGDCQVGIESTVVDVTGDVAIVLRPGDVSEADIAEVVEVAAAGAVRGAGPARSPGQAVRHYAPRCPVDVLPFGDIPGMELLSDDGVWLLWMGENPPQGERVVALGMDPKAVAARLYAAMHQADDAGARRIVVAGLPTGPAWVAVADRLRRAAVTKPAGVMDSGKK
ncbi:MAG: hypothetical protein RLZZ78_1140 [Armatimonadota bacterium]